MLVVISVHVHALYMYMYTACMYFTRTCTLHVHVQHMNMYCTCIPVSLTSTSDRCLDTAAPLLMDCVSAVEVCAYTLRCTVCALGQSHLCGYCECVRVWQGAGIT